MSTALFWILFSAGHLLALEAGAQRARGRWHLFLMLWLISALVMAATIGTGIQIYESSP